MRSANWRRISWGLQYFLDRKMPIMRVRPFNHIGPRQNERFVAPSFAKQIVEIERGRREPVLRLGNMAAQRDFTDVRDIVRAYICWRSSRASRARCITSGQAGRDRCARCWTLCWPPARSRSPKRPIRPNSGRATRRSRTLIRSKFKRQTGWEPRHHVRADVPGYSERLARAHPN